MNTLFTYNSNWNPSLHIGAARTAILNSLFANKTGGKFVICCDDFTEGHNTHQRLLLNNLKWLGLGSYSGVYFHRHFIDDYERASKHLLDCKWAYEEDGCIKLRVWRANKSIDIMEYVVVEDLVNGNTTYDLAAACSDDIVLKDKRGHYTHYLTLPVNCKIWNIDCVFTDVRNLYTLPAQLYISRRLGIKRIPKFVHTPLLIGPIGNSRFSQRNHKTYENSIDFLHLMSKCENATGDTRCPFDSYAFYPCYVEFYRLSGFLPNALKHYLISTFTKDSIFNTIGCLSSDYMAKSFNLSTCVPKTRRFDASMLLELQRTYFRQLDLNSKAWMINDFLYKIGLSKFWFANSVLAPEKLRLIVLKLSDKLSIAGDILSLTHCFDAGLNLVSDEQNNNDEVSDFIFEGCPNC